MVTPMMSRGTGPSLWTRWRNRKHRQRVHERLLPVVRRRVDRKFWPLVDSEEWLQYNPERKQEDK